MFLKEEKKKKKVKYILQYLMSNQYNRKLLKQLLLRNSIDSLFDFVVEVVNDKIKEYKSSKENAWRSFFKLILYSENSKREY